MASVNECSLVNFQKRNTFNIAVYFQYYDIRPSVDSKIKFSIYKKCRLEAENKKSVQTTFISDRTAMKITSNNKDRKEVTIQINKTKVKILKMRSFRYCPKNFDF